MSRESRRTTRSFLLAGALLVAAIVVMLIVTAPPSRPQPELEQLAECLTSKGVTMYGAEWCSHCQNEKRKFGDAFKKINYVECPRNTQKCSELGINGYPTWIFGDGRRFEGEQGPEKLAALSGCPLPTSTASTSGD